MRLIHREMDELAGRLRRRPSDTLHWSEIRRHEQRKFVASTLASLPIATISIVIAKALRAESDGTKDPARAYNYALRLLLERVSWFVDDQHGRAILNFAHVKHHPYAELAAYLQRLRDSTTEIRWEAVSGQPRVDQPNNVRLLQLADLAAGCHASALRRDEFDAFEQAYLLTLASRVYIRPGGRVTSYGLKFMPELNPATHLPWWGEFLDACAGR